MTRDELWTQLADLFGIAKQYTGWRGDPVVATQATTTAMVCALSAGFGVAVTPTSSDDDLRAAIAGLRRQRATSGAPPVVVSWDGAEVAFGFAVRADRNGRWRIDVKTEAGHAMPLQGTLFDLEPSDHLELDGAPYCTRTLRFAVGELGYHQAPWQLEFDDGSRQAGHCLIIAAPTVAYQAPSLPPRRWGVFAPVYGLRTPWTGGLGDLYSLSHLMRLVTSWGGHYVATLPLLAGFFDEPCQVSPYSPATKLFWNELYLDHFEASHFQKASGYIDGAGYNARARLFESPTLPYREQYAWRRAELERLATAAWQDPALRSQLEAWMARNPDAVDYAVFRALGEHFRAPWSQWPAAWRDHPKMLTNLATIEDKAARQAAEFHIYAQWTMQRQLGRLRSTLGAQLYLDMPVGVNADAYEVWRRRELFVLHASTGAPPDELFLGGQDWGLPPVHPWQLRVDQYRYFIACVREHMRYAGMLRIDHVMGLWRLYCVPHGLGATDGAYIHYQADEQLAILTLESHRQRCALVGENLGTVPAYVPPTMARHGLLGLHIGQFAMPDTVGDAPGAAPAASVASLNTHDMALFMGWWQGQDIDDRHALGLIDAAKRTQAHAHREQTKVALRHFAGVAESPAQPQLAPYVVMRKLTGHLLASEAAVVLLSLEDLWLEPLPQNVPGTSHQRPNWQRPFARTLADLGAMPAMLGFTDKHPPGVAVEVDFLAGLVRA